MILNKSLKSLHGKADIHIEGGRPGNKPVPRLLITGPDLPRSYLQRGPMIEKAGKAENMMHKIAADNIMKNNCTKRNFSGSDLRAAASDLLNNELKELGTRLPKEDQGRLLDLALMAYIKTEIKQA